jgi:hypothetical protein
MAEEEEMSGEDWGKRQREGRGGRMEEERNEVITLETVALDTPNNVAGFMTVAPAKGAPTVCPSKSDKSAIFRFFHTDSHSTQSLMQSYEDLRTYLLKPF